MTQPTTGLKLAVPSAIDKNIVLTALRAHELELKAGGIIHLHRRFRRVSRRN